MSPWNPQAHLVNCDFQLDQYSWECTCGVFDNQPAQPLCDHIRCRQMGRDSTCSNRAKREPIDWWAKVKMLRLMKKIGVIR